MNDTADTFINISLAKKGQAHSTVVTASLTVWWYRYEEERDLRCRHNVPTCIHPVLKWVTRRTTDIFTGESRIGYKPIFFNTPIEERNEFGVWP